jgi:hypothetical protein
MRYHVPTTTSTVATMRPPAISAASLFVRPSRVKAPHLKSALGKRRDSRICQLTVTRQSRHRFNSAPSPPATRKTRIARVDDLNSGGGC